MSGANGREKVFKVISHAEFAEFAVKAKGKPPGLREMSVSHVTHAAGAENHAQVPVEVVGAHQSHQHPGQTQHPAAAGSEPLGGTDGDRKSVV